MYLGPHVASKVQQNISLSRPHNPGTKYIRLIIVWRACLDVIFHLSQIDAMAKTGAQTGGSTLDNFSHYQYAPSTTPAPIAHNPRKASLLRQSVTRQSITRLDLSTSHGSGAYNDPFAHKINAVPDIG